MNCGSVFQELKIFEVDIPGYKKLTLTHLVLDFNGTPACDGNLLPGVSEGSKICSIVTSESRRLGLGEGDRVWALFNSASVVLLSE